MELIKFEKNTQEDEILKALKGKDFIAISINPNDAGGYTYTFHVNNMQNEYIICAVELLKQRTLNLFEDH